MGGIGFLLVFLLGEGGDILSGLLLISAGLVWRFVAAGYIGKDARSPFIEAKRVVKEGSYGIMRHPLYVGNGLLVGGVILLFNPPPFVWVSVILGFVFLYGLIAREEEKKMLRQFTWEYREYKRSVGILFPKSKKRVEWSSFSLSNAWQEVYTFLTLLAILFLFFLRFYFFPQFIHFIKRHIFQFFSAFF